MNYSMSIKFQSVCSKLLLFRSTGGNYTKTCVTLLHFVEYSFRFRLFRATTGSSKSSARGDERSRGVVRIPTPIAPADSSAFGRCTRTPYLITGLTQIRRGSESCWKSGPETRAAGRGNS